MTAGAAPTDTAAPSVAERAAAGQRRARRALTAVEARRAVTAPWVWIGIACTTWFASTNASTFAGGGYRNLMASFAGVAAGLFVLAVDAGGRDHAIGGGPLAPDAVMGADARALGRLLGLWPAFSVAVAFTGVVFAVRRIAGSMWIADLPAGRDHAHFTVVEMLQPPLVFAVVLAAGVALGRASSHRSITSVAGALAIVTMGLGYWVWQWTPAVWVTLVQTQPIEVRLGGGFVPTDAPSTWMLSAPDRYGSRWGHVIVHQSMVGWHLVYLAGLAALFAGLAIRGRHGRAVGIAGIVTAVGAVVAQIIVTPTGLAGA